MSARFNLKLLWENFLPKRYCDQGKFHLPSWVSYQTPVGPNLTLVPAFMGFPRSQTTMRVWFSVLKAHDSLAKACNKPERNIKECHSLCLNTWMKVWREVLDMLHSFQYDFSAITQLSTKMKQNVSMEVSKETNVFATRQISSQGYKKEGLGKNWSLFQCFALRLK